MSSFSIRKISNVITIQITAEHCCSCLCYLCGCFCLFFQGIHCFLEQFQVHSKTEQKVQKFPLTSYTHSFPHYQHPTSKQYIHYSLTVMNVLLLHTECIIHIYRKCIITLTYCYLPKTTLICITLVFYILWVWTNVIKDIRHHSIIQSSLLPLKSSVLCLFLSDL